MGWDGVGWGSHARGLGCGLVMRVEYHAKWVRVRVRVRVSVRTISVRLGLGVRVA